MCNPDAGQRRAGIRPHLARGPVCLCRTSPASCAACAGSLRRGTRPIGTGTSLHASVRDTSDWQFACLPSAPQYCGATPTEAVPFLGSAVSSTTRTGSSQEPRGRRICRSHRPSARSSRWLLPHVLLGRRVGLGVSVGLPTGCQPGTSRPSAGSVPRERDPLGSGSTPPAVLPVGELALPEGSVGQIVLPLTVFHQPPRRCQIGAVGGVTGRTSRRVRCSEISHQPRTIQTARRRAGCRQSRSRTTNGIGRRGLGPGGDNRPALPY